MINAIIVLNMLKKTIASIPLKEVAIVATAGVVIGIMSKAEEKERFRKRLVFGKHSKKQV